MAAAELPLGEWLAAHKAAEYEQALRAEGCESVSDLVESGLISRESAWARAEKQELFEPLCDPSFLAEHKAVS